MIQKVIEDNAGLKKIIKHVGQKIEISMERHMDDNDTSTNNMNFCNEIQTEIEVRLEIFLMIK